MWAVDSFCLSMGLSAAIHSLESVVPINYTWGGSGRLGHLHLGGGSLQSTWICG